ncbi:MAG: ROK family protein [Planctomycetota bacterium]|jgi:glucokinase
MAERKLIGIDLGGTNLRAAAVDEKGRILGRARTDTRAAEGPDAVIARLAEVAREAARDAGFDLAEAAACCVGSPGPLDAATGVVIMTPNLPGWDNTPVASPMTRLTGVPTFLENDANSACWGEFWRGAGRGSSEMAIYTLGTGVGGSVVVAGRLHRGRDQMAGHLGHAILVPDGRQCNCGAKGCLEQYCSATAVAREARGATRGGEKTGLGEIAPEEITARAVHEAAVAGSAYCKALIERTGRYLGIGIASLVNTLDPQVVVIFGGMAAAGEMLLGPCREAVREHALPPAKDRVRIVPAELGEDAGVIGAAGLALRRLDGEKA